MDYERYRRAIDLRCSRRCFIDKKIRLHDIDALEELIETCNAISGLSIRLVRDADRLIGRRLKTFNLFEGARDFILIAGKTYDHNRMEKEGYYGEKLVLEATFRGLSSCWISTGLDMKACPKLPASETIDCAIALGYSDERHSLRERILEGHLKNRRRRDRWSLIDGQSDEAYPPWFLSGLDAVMKAPSYRNLKPARFYLWLDQVACRAAENHSKVMIDMGIAKLHFQIGAGGGHWKKGDGGLFSLQ